MLRCRRERETASLWASGWHDRAGRHNRWIEPHCRSLCRANSGHRTIALRSLDRHLELAVVENVIALLERPRRQNMADRPRRKVSQLYPHARWNVETFRWPF